LGKGQEFDQPDDMLQGHLRQVIAVIPSRKLVILRMGMAKILATATQRCCALS
jgi:hypothetical protein